MKPDSNRVRILKVLFPGNVIISSPITGPELRIKSGLTPLKFIQEIRALISLEWVTSRNYRYEITEAGKKALIECLKKETQDGKNKELFNETHN